MWIYQGQTFTEDMIENNVGYVYEIVNITNGKTYIGKKLFTKSKTYQKNKKKKKTRVSSDWLVYTGSNKELNEDIKQGHRIQKYILYLCKTRGWCSFYETKEILEKNALTDPMYYNDWVSCKIRKEHLK